MTVAPKPREFPKRPLSPQLWVDRDTKRRRNETVPQPSSSPDSFANDDTHITIPDDDDKVDTDNASAACHAVGNSPLPFLDDIKRVLSRRERLRDTNWLTDEVMNSLIGRLSTDTIGVADSLQLVLQHPRPPKRPSAAKATGGGKESSDSPRYISELAGKDTLIIPAHDQKARHWRLYRCERPEAGKELVLERFDPIAEMPGQGATDADARRLLRAVFDLPPDHPIPVLERPCPQQPNGYDCGPYTIATAYYLAAHPAGAAGAAIPSGTHSRRYDGPDISAATLDGPALRRWLADILLTSPSAALPYSAVVEETARGVLVQSLCILTRRIHAVKEAATLHQLPPNVTGRTQEDERRLYEAFCMPDIAAVGRLIFVSAMREFHRIHEVSLQASVTALGRLQQHTKELALLHQFLALRRLHGHQVPPSGSSNGSGETWRSSNGNSNRRDLAWADDQINSLLDAPDVGDDERKLREVVGEALRLNVAYVVVMKVVMQTKSQASS